MAMLHLSRAPRAHQHIDSSLGLRLSASPQRRQGPGPACRQAPQGTAASTAPHSADTMPAARVQGSGSAVEAISDTLVTSLLGVMVQREPRCVTWSTCDGVLNASLRSSSQESSATRSFKCCKSDVRSWSGDAVDEVEVVKSAAWHFVASASLLDESESMPAGSRPFEAPSSASSVQLASSPSLTESSLGIASDSDGVLCERCWPRHRPTALRASMQEPSRGAF
mmetsp:Transcript_110593/g.312728  ORF Transcript_110593/g.312728 Transcript_110593/m.312728 type:complete len:224 (+) Transcript_110593:75-746(+)